MSSSPATEDLQDRLRTLTDVLEDALVRHAHDRSAGWAARSLEALDRLGRAARSDGPEQQLPLLDAALDRDPALDGLRGYVEDTGEGRWTVEEAIRLAVPMNVIAASLFARFASRQEDSPAMKAVAALRNQFGGHAVHTKQ